MTADKNGYDCEWFVERQARGLRAVLGLRLGNTGGGDRRRGPQFPTPELNYQAMS